MIWWDPVFTNIAKIKLREQKGSPGFSKFKQPSAKISGNMLDSCFNKKVSSPETRWALHHCLLNMANLFTKFN